MSKNVLSTLLKIKRHLSHSINSQLKCSRLRVVITGLGIVSPLGVGTRYSWEALLRGKCGIDKLTGIDYDQLPCKIAALVPKGNNKHEFNLSARFTNQELRTMSLATAYALTAAEEALTDANWIPINEEDRRTTGVAVGIGMIDLVDVCFSYENLKKGYNKVSPYFIPRILPNMAAGQISIKYGFRGPNHSVSTACATGAHAIGDGFRFIREGLSSVMVCGGSEACINPLAIAAFCRMRALSTSKNESPLEASRPFDKDRDGFVMGEGAAILVLEELSHALRRKAHIYAEILGYGLSGDAIHLTSPSEDGIGAMLAMERALHDARSDPTDITYINAHATSTLLGDSAELQAIESLFDKHSEYVTVSSTKGAHGHLLGASGNVETAYTILALKEGLIPPTLNLYNIDSASKLKFVPHKMQEWSTNSRRVALKNSFGFGGTNASLCLAEYIR